MRAAVLLLGALWAGCSPLAAPPATVEVSCVPETRALRQRCTVSLTDRQTGRPIAGEAVTLSADMPSMPLAHSVRPVAAAPGSRPGMYQATLELEMMGRWVVTVRVSGPTLYHQATRTIDVATR